MKCPHCLDSFHDKPEIVNLGEHLKTLFEVLHCICPACDKTIIRLKISWDKHYVSGTRSSFWSQNEERLVFPRSMSRSPLSPDVPSPYRDDYLEACAVLSISPKASGALSRRCLQMILRDKAGIVKKDLWQEIEETVKTKNLPSHISTALDAVRHIGNFAAHPIKSTSTGEIFEVEPGEAEWTIDVIESLFDYYFVQPATLQKKKDALNAKLKAAGKKEMK